MTRFLAQATVFFRLIFSGVPRRVGALALALSLVAAGAWADTTLSGSSSSSSSSSSTSSSRSNLSDYIRDKMSSSSSSKSKAGKTTPANVHDAARKKNVVTRQAQAKGKAASKQKQEAFPKLTPPKGFQTDALFLAPSQSRVLLGDRFRTTVAFYDVKSSSANEVNLWLRYDPTILQLEDLNVHPLDGNRPTSLTTSVLPTGLVHVRAKLAVPFDQVINPICTANWRAIAPSMGTRMDMIPPSGGEPLAVLRGTKNLVATTNLGTEAWASASVSVAVAEEDEDAEPLAMADQVLDRMTPVSLEASKRVRLIVRPARASLAMGEVSTADVVLVNPENRPLDRLRFCLRYDSSVVKVLDADQNNYISEGINAFDGDFHDRFPFNDYRENRVDPSQGVIVYDMGLSDGVAKTFSTGVVARVVFRMLRSTGEATFSFERSKPLTGQVMTDVSNGGVSLLGPDDAAARQALHDGRVMARLPEVQISGLASKPARVATRLSR